MIDGRAGYVNKYKNHAASPEITKFEVILNTELYC